MTRDDLIQRYEAAIAASGRFERKGKANPYTSANGHMFSQINKDDQLGIRLPKSRQAELLAEYGAGPFKSYGATMRDYVCLTDDMLAMDGLIKALLDEGFEFVSAMPPGGKK
ncbi:MAG: hypothetical protein NXH72_13540 [Hyphomonadaceae bacterium]|nr:hypothetical protein [Hyphomonadaceae bacterium]